MTQATEVEPAALGEELSRRFGTPYEMKVVVGGLFNRVRRVHGAGKTGYLKQFDDKALSGSFPPLPTTAAQRCYVAATWHARALEASLRAPQVRVPVLEAVSIPLNFVLMGEVPGEPLHNALVEHGDFEQISSVVQRCTEWLAALHQLPLDRRAEMAAATAPFKRFKIELQYVQLLPLLDRSKRRSSEDFIQRYLASDEMAVHGDLNSRNILVGPGAGVSIIDFEQGHLGEGVYDLAYLLSELVIRRLADDVEPRPVVEQYFSSYRRHFSDDADLARRFFIHLGFQTLYRLVGPSRAVWSGHLGERELTRVREWGHATLSAWL